MIGSPPSGGAGGGFTRTLGKKQYFLTDHRGNNNVTVSDKKIPLEDLNNPGTILYFEPDIVRAVDYFPFGREMNGREFNKDASEFGYNGKQNIKEWSVRKGGPQLYGDRIKYDVIFITRDALSKDFPYLSPYVYAANSPIIIIDPDGKKIIFVNGKIGGGSPPAGREYWNYDKVNEGEFVKGAKKYFNDNQTFYTDKDYGYLSNVKERKADGFAYAKDNFDKITEGIDKEKDVFRIVTHSMGAAFGEGIAEYLKSQGYKIETIVHINAFQAADIETTDPNTNETETIDYQNTDDPVINNPIRSSPGAIKGADAVIREKSGVNKLTTIHTSPIWNQGKKFWETLKGKILKTGYRDNINEIPKSPTVPNGTVPENSKG